MSERTALRASVVIALAVAASGCINLAPRYERPEMPVESEWRSPQETPGAQQQEDNGAAVLPWRQFFKSEKLQGVIDLALKNNRDLRIAALNVERTQALFRI